MKKLIVFRSIKKITHTNTFYLNLKSWQDTNVIRKIISARAYEKINLRTGNDKIYANGILPKGDFLKAF